MYAQHIRFLLNESVYKENEKKKKSFNEKNTQTLKLRFMHFQLGYRNSFFFN